MPTLVRLLITILLGVLIVDFNGLRPELFQELIDQHGDYAYMGAAMIIAGLSVPTVVGWFD